MNLQFNKYKELRLTSLLNGKANTAKTSIGKRVITGWSKRDDHRHHAIDTCYCLHKTVLHSAL
ncbi:MAG: hypothetical protein H6536_01790 [Bacteroidales bacterium]|nr:hypothetical protein [Bacteroidales bacterium]